MKLLNVLQSLVLATFLILIFTSQTCKKVNPLSCEGFELSYGKLEEVYGLSFDGNQQAQDRFYTANLYYKSNNPNIQGIKIDFESSHFEQFDGNPMIANSSNSSTVELLSPNPFSVTAGSTRIMIGTIKWRVKYSDFGNTAIGKQRFILLDNIDNQFLNCRATFNHPPIDESLN